MTLARRRLLGLLAGSTLLAACGRSSASVVVSERPVHGSVPPERAPPSVLATPARVPTARPTPRPIERVDDGGLQRELERFLKEQGGAYGVAIRDLHGPVSATFLGDDRFPLGSLYKVVLMAEVLRQSRLGRLTLGTTIATLPEYNFGEPPGGIPPNTRTSVEAALSAMIGASSNAAALALTELVGPAELVAAPRRFGLRETQIDVETVNGPGHYQIDARSTANDLVALLVKLDREQVVGPDQDRRMVDFMLKQRIVDRLPLLLPADLPIAHKTADLDSYTHDAGLVYLPGRPYAIAILGQGLNLTEGKSIVAEVSRIAWAYFNARR